MLGLFLRGIPQQCPRTKFFLVCQINVDILTPYEQCSNFLDFDFIQNHCYLNFYAPTKVALYTS